jgi:2-dehydropantoate 2-reductase
MKAVYIFGGGVVGMALAVHLANSGREVRLIRTSGNALTESTVDIVVTDLGIAHRATVPCSSITQLEKPDGLLVIATKAFANAAICKALLRKQANGPIVLLQNGLSVERAFLEGGFPEIYRGVLYLTAQRESDTTVSFHPVKPSLLGVVRGTDEGFRAA